MSAVEQSLTQADILAGLRRLGVAPGDALEVHSSLRSLGRMTGGAASVIRALQEAVGPTGALVMPAYPVGPGLAPSSAEQARGITWKVRILPFSDHTTPTGMGAIADTFRDCSGVRRETGAFFSYAAWGRNAEMYAREGLAPLVASGGKALLLGVEMDRCSSLHLAEERVALPPALAALLTPPADITRDYPDDEWGVGFGPEPNFLMAQAVAEAQGLIQTERIGQAVARLFNAQALVVIYERLLLTQPYAVYGLLEPRGE
ncbi:MAG TPA: AAC(3) family N-acetyltransferase [Ktedonobacterales bacterium]|nr:AAC(3) family N-acetyltransferase [Ktedonobacterales bacterium]